MPLTSALLVPEQLAIAIPQGRAHGLSFVQHWVAHDWDADTGVWLTFLHVAYYNIGSALQVFALHKDPTQPGSDLLKLPCATERRAHRLPTKLARHLQELANISLYHGGLHAWMHRHIVWGDPVASWHAMSRELQTVYGNGRWAAYKTCEMLWKVNGFNLAAPDMGHANSTGPRHGMALLYQNLPQDNSQSTIRLLDGLSLDVINNLEQRNVKATIETAETSLCDFHALVDGRYYVGHDIDGMQQQLITTPSNLTARAFAARRKTIPNEYLGELGGWVGVQADRKRIYRDTGQIITRRQQ